MREFVTCRSCGTTADAEDLYCQTCGTRLGADTDGRADARPDGPAPAPARASRPAPARRRDGVSEATRFMCVGAYLDDGFSKKVLRELFGQTFRAVAPSYGFDLGLVAGHCLAARHSRRIRDIVLTVLGVAMLLVGAVPTVFAGVAAWWLGWLLGALGQGTDGLREKVYRVRWRSVILAIIVGWLAVTLAGIFAALITVLRGGLAAPGVSSAPPTPGVIGVQPAVSSPADAIMAAVVGVLITGLITIGGWVVLYVVVLVDLVLRRRTVVRDLSRAAFRARPERRIPLSKRLQDRLEALAWSQLGNVTIYSGYDPFIGTGWEMKGWSFAVPLVPASGSDEPVEAFPVPELVDHVRSAIGDIAAVDDDGSAVARPGDNMLPGLAVSDHVFVNGLAIEGDDRFLAAPGSPPRTRLSEEDVRRIVGQPHGVVRHYLCARVVSWGGEICTFSFFHFSTDGEKLYCECVRRVLGPVRREYHRVDMLPAYLPGGEFMRLAAEAAARTVPAVVGAPGRLIGDLRFDLREDRPPTDVRIDYGARLAVSELAEDDLFHNYFQKLDVDKHLKIVERQALGAIAQFLEAHGIDASEFRNRQTTILNSGIVQIGASNTIGAATFGTGSRATNTADGGTRGAEGAPQEGIKS